MSSRIESSLDEPFFTTGDANDGRRAGGHDRDVELSSLSSAPARETMRTHVVIVLVRYQSMLAVDEYPVEIAIVEDCLGKRCGREAISLASPK